MLGYTYKIKMVSVDKFESDEGYTDADVVEVAVLADSEDKAAEVADPNWEYCILTIEELPEW